ncbi:AAA family ATPase [Paracoccus aminophilus]|uniref:ATP-dependent protease La n=1 Tax=Paracoccus aminophilus JCM 7686 TaxID=1367847 RepID=S5YD22_PARAH|nr:AAA family ATPase [Paracoccus aminophilus]AGT09363.1 ATP-dependent protease La [Paracoccus aminophilus JCM 7686]
MPSIRFIQSQLPDPMRSQEAIADRFLRNAKIRLARRSDMAIPRSIDGSIDQRSFDKFYPDLRLSYDQTHEIHRRATRIARWHEQSSPFYRMKDADRDILLRLREGAEVIPPPREEEAHRIGAALHAEMPWMSAASTLIMRDMLLSQKRKEIGFRCRPVILNGPPGVGKSFWARRLAELLGAPSIAIDATGESAGFSVGGVQKGWGSATPGRPLSLILQERIANPFIIIDEVEKAGRASSMRDTVPSITDALLPLLEPLSAAQWSCPYYQLVFDMSWISWIFTTNTVTSLPEPFLSRCRVVTVGQVMRDDLHSFARRQGKRRSLSAPSIEAILEVIIERERARQSVNLRMINRMLDLAEILETAPMLN